MIDNDLEFGPNHKEMSPQPIKSPSSEDIFGRKTKLLRSPIIKTNPQPQLQSMDTPNKIETAASHVENKVVSDTAIIEKLNKFEKLCETLQKQVDDLKLENQRLKESLTSKAKDTDPPMDIETPSVTEFHTDEEELARETEWILQRNKKRNAKKRKAEHSPEVDIPTQSSKLTKEKNHNINKKPKLPPVILSNISDFNNVQDVMSSQNILYEIKLLNNKQLSIKVNSDNDYRTLTKAMNDANFEWHSYENKATRPCKVIARGLHPTCKPENIVDDLKAQGFNALSAINLTKKKKVKDTQIKDPLPLFMLTFDHSEDIKKIFSITHIVKTKVKIEAIRKRREQIPQCKRCQRFEHTQSFCKREARCVKCAGSHLTIECTLDKKAPPKCSNCHEAHPASYRGCMVAKELQKRRMAKKKVDVTKAKQQKLPTQSTVKEGSYADAVRKGISVSALNPKSSVKVHKSPKKGNSVEDLLIQNLERMNNKFDEISKRLEKIEKRYASMHIGTPRRILKK